MKIKDFILLLSDKGYNINDISTSLNLTPGMISRYKQGDVNPRFDVAVRIYNNFGVVIYPFDEKALKAELTKGE